jgi:CheY-like chemotaxis protein
MSFHCQVQVRVHTTFDHASPPESGNVPMHQYERLSCLDLHTALAISSRGSLRQHGYYLNPAKKQSANKRVATLPKCASIGSSMGADTPQPPATATAKIGAPRSEPCAPSKILVVDDEPSIRDVLRDLLTAAGYTVVTASDGREALPMALADKPDLIISDIRMPKLDGLTLCKALRVNPETKSIPIIMLTSYNTSEHMEAAMAAGADDFLPKPLNVEEVKIRVRSLLKLKHITDEVQRLQQYILALRPQPGQSTEAGQ